MSQHPNNPSHQHPPKKKPISTKKLAVMLTCAAVTLTVGLLLLIMGFFVPPLGVIDPSVLVAAGEALSFVGSVFGIKFHYQYKYGEAN